MPKRFFDVFLDMLDFSIGADERKFAALSVSGFTGFTDLDSVIVDMILGKCWKISVLFE